jgi:NAD(P)-dependent dehydrogenase (short-subunit alcohol dehydrogenase family)
VSIQSLLSFTGKRAVVTGAASGMGLATIRYLAELGAEIVALDVGEVEDGPWTALRVDIGDRASVDAAAAAIEGPIHALINVAGVAGGRGREKPAMMVNFFGLRHLTDLLVPKLPPGSAIVNVSSLAGYRYAIDRSELEPMLALESMEAAAEWLDEEDNQSRFNGYGTSKQLLNLWTVLRCKELADERGIRINVVGPGTTDTPLLGAFKANAVERTGSDAGVEAAKGFLGRYAHAEDQAAACVFLASDAAAMITGQVIYVDGGMAGAMQAGVLATPAVRTR